MASTPKVIALVYSDLHIENWKKFNEGKRRLKNSLDVIKKLNLEAKKLKVPKLFLGDLYHKEKGITNELMEDTLPKVFKYFQSSEMTYAITGNHDQSSENIPGKTSPSYIKTLSQICKGLDCVDNESRDIGKMVLHGVPYYTHDIGLLETIKSFKLIKGKLNVLMLHTTMPGARDTDGRVMQAHISTEKFYEAISRFDIVLCGHIHKPEKFEIKGVQVIQVGAPQQQRLTDRNCKMGYWELYDDASVMFVEMKYPKFIEIENLSDKKSDGNFYVEVKKAKEKENISGKVQRTFNTLKKDKLAKEYCKEKSITDIKKRKALTKALKSTE